MRQSMQRRLTALTARYRWLHAIAYRSGSIRTGGEYANVAVRANTDPTAVVATDELRRRVREKLAVSAERLENALASVQEGHALLTTAEKLLSRQDREHFYAKETPYTLPGSAVSVQRRSPSSGPYPRHCSTAIDSERWQ